MKTTIAFDEGYAWNPINQLTICPSMATVWRVLADDQDQDDTTCMALNN